ncbi:MAG: ABC transporter substrate-binding protein [Alphaproteobacteria bacterium]|nr:ABC transporter substrate-binding protein [Alphaproteobacteria bacterium]
MNFSIFKKAVVACVTAAALTSSVYATDTKTYTDSLGRKVEIPTDAKRIVSLHDMVLTVPLIELGILPVGSHGRTTDDGTPFIRSSKAITGYDFDNSDIEFMGNWPADVEKVVTAKPDLILTTSWQGLKYGQIENIAPTLVINSESTIEVFDMLAEITGSGAQLDILKSRYAQQIADIKRIIDTENITVNVIQPYDGNLYVEHTYGNLGKVLRDAGFKFPKIVDDIAVGGDASFSAEKLQDLDADYVFVTYRTDQLQTPQDSIDGLEKVIPGFCDYFSACKKGRMLVMPREAATTSSFDALSITASNVLTHISGNPYAKK